MASYHARITTRFSKVDSWWVVIHLIWSVPVEASQIIYRRKLLSDDGMYSFLVHKQEGNILRVQIQSRHTSSKVYNLWIETNVGPNPISGWYCQCKSGARVVDCCAHIASVLWYLGCSKYHQDSQLTSMMPHAGRKKNRHLLRMVSQVLIN